MDASRQARVPMSTGLADTAPGRRAPRAAAGRLEAAPRIEAVGTCLPPHVLGQGVARRYAARLFQGLPDSDRLLAVFDHGHVRTRHLVVPPEEILLPRSFVARNREYVRHALALCEGAARSALRAAGRQASELDAVILVSSTGIATPSLDAHLLNRMGFPSHIRRVPLWGLGCAGGAAGVGLAADLVRARPVARVLLLAVEVCSLTFQGRDISKRNLVAASLFADGAAAAVLAGPEAAGGPARGGVRRGGRDDGEGLRQAWPAAGATAVPRVVASRSTTWPDSLEVMGWRLRDSGLEVVFSRQIPVIVARRMRRIVDEFLAEHGLELGDIRHFVAHPGGSKVLQAYATALDLDPEALRHSREVLRACGNMSSPSVLFVLERCLASGDARSGDLGLLTALGPGFSAELVLLAW